MLEPSSLSALNQTVWGKVKAKEKETSKQTNFPDSYFANLLHADLHTKEIRSYNMSRIKGKNTKPEMLMRKFLFANGYRYKLHDKPSRQTGYSFI